VAAGDAPSAARAGGRPRLVGEHDGLRAVASLAAFAGLAALLLLLRRDVV
jgi:hypothetical protein